MTGGPRGRRRLTRRAALGAAAGVAAAALPALAGCPALPGAMPEGSVPGRWGLVDSSGSWAVAPMFRGLGSPWGGRCFVSVLPTGGYHVASTDAMIDEGDAYVVWHTWGQIPAGARPSDVAFAARPGSGWGIALPDGTWATDEGAFRAASLFEAPVGPFDSSSGLAAARDAASGLWGLVAADGSWSAPPAFLALDPPVASGLAGALDPATRLWGLVDASGSWAVPPSFAALGREPASPLCPALDPATGLWGHVAADGAWAVAPAFPEVTGFDPSGSRALAADGDAGLGVIDASGSWVSAARFPDACPFGDGALAAARWDGGGRA